jgi:hypothetical protein
MAADGRSNHPPGNPNWASNQVARVDMIASHTLDQAVGLLGGNPQTTGNMEQDMFGRQVCLSDYIPGGYILTLAHNHFAWNR